jgi:hypothetical protein
MCQLIFWDTADSGEKARLKAWEACANQRHGDSLGLSGEKFVGYEKGGLVITQNRPIRCSTLDRQTPLNHEIWIDAKHPPEQGNLLSTRLACQAESAGFLEENRCTTIQKLFDSHARVARLVARTL